MFDVMQLLKKHGTIIYTKDRGLDLSLMEDELRELYEWKMIDQTVFQQALLILRQEASGRKE
ncbi:YqgQ family protein [Halalkalibacter oceani]|nr:YqgQ family protein [Halalkalibacter oceani]